MVDAIVSFTVERLGDFLIQKAVFLAGVRHDVEWLKNTLQYMQCLLKDAEERKDEDHRIRKWVSDIAEVAYDADDVIDNFILKIEDGGTQTEGGPPRKIGFKAFLTKYFCICKKEAYIYKEANLYNIGKEIEQLKIRLTEIDQNRQTFQIRNIGDIHQGFSQTNERLRQLRRTSPYADDDYIIGFEQDAELLKAELLTDQPHRCVISILGMGGLGKTTLARKIYNSSSIKDQFHCYAWVSVSKEYNTLDLLQRIMKSFKPPNNIEQMEMLEKMKVDDLERELRMFLKGHRYLVVIDDVWEKEAWESLKRAFPDNKNRSRVIITTRIKVVAERLDERTYVYKLPFLTEEESWTLFCKKAFPNDGAGNQRSCCPPNLEKLGKDMVRRCNGLPLAIVVLGGLMSRKRNDEWPKVRDRFWQVMQDESIHVKHLLDLSYNDLPCELKLCFLYLGLFPEDFEIEVEKLSHLLVAEGFIQPDQGTLEDLAAEYLNELIGRNLIQVAERRWRRIYYCRVHDLLRDLAIEKAKELNFLRIYETMIQHSTLSPNSLLFRRLASHSGLKSFTSSNHSFPRLRTLHFFGEEAELEEIDHSVVLTQTTNFRLLRVLDFQGITFWKPEKRRRLPDAVGVLIHLRYLGLRGTGIANLPPSIGKLQALQFLDGYSFGHFLLLPDEIWDIKQLRHLYGENIRWPSRVNNLRNLQILKSVEVDGELQFDPMNLINLRELCLSCRSRGFTLDSIGKLRSLRNLDVQIENSIPFPALQPLSQCQDLVQLKLYGRIEILPREMHDFLPNLKYLLLCEVGMKEDPMPTLEKLPNLTIFDFEARGFRGNELVCRAGGFPQLQILQLSRCNVKELRVDEGGMPLLNGFRLIMCNLKIPKRLKSIPAPKDWDWPTNFRFSPGCLHSWPY